MTYDLLAERRPLSRVDPYRGEHPDSDTRSLVTARVRAELVRLRRAGRHSVAIVDPACGPGVQLISAAREAQSLGFTAIEGRGFDRSTAMVALARMAALAVRHPAIGLSFHVAGPDTMLNDPDDPDDILLHLAMPATA